MKEFERFKDRVLENPIARERYEQLTRPIVAYVRRDDISWWAGCEYADRGPFETYIREQPAVSRRGAARAARRLARNARRLREQGYAGYKEIIPG